MTFNLKTIFLKIITYSFYPQILDSTMKKCCLSRYGCNVSLEVNVKIRLRPFMFLGWIWTSPFYWNRITWTCKIFQLIWLVSTHYQKNYNIEYLELNFSKVFFWQKTICSKSKKCKIYSHIKQNYSTGPNLSSYGQISWFMSRTIRPGHQQAHQLSKKYSRA